MEDKEINFRPLKKKKKRCTNSKENVGAIYRHGVIAESILLLVNFFKKRKIPFGKLRMFPQTCTPCLPKSKKVIENKYRNIAYFIWTLFGI